MLLQRCAAVASVFLISASALAAAAPAGVEDAIAVIVQAPADTARAAHAVQQAGGTVTRDLPIVGGFAATVPEHAVSGLSAVPGVTVTADRALRPAGKPSRPPKATTVPSVHRTEVGSAALVAGGTTGNGIRVALIDTGVDTAVASGGDLAGRVVPVADPVSPGADAVGCVNFSGESTCDDTFGHGTFMAGLIAGTGVASTGTYTGAAPGAQIVSVKVGGADGSADVSKVLAGIQWVVSFADTYNIKVLNLSMGTDSTVSPTIDPLNLAVQRAWVEGITVVVSAGNFGRPASGASHGTVTKPGDDPFVITVGAVDDVETTKITDDRLPGFSSWGPTAHGVAKPDVVAPGGRLVSLRAPGSTVDALPGSIDATYRRGSGTSMAAAVVSGLAAQLLQVRSAWQPDDVKAALVAGATPVASNDPNAIGAGLVNGPAALAASISPTYRMSVLSTGLGTLTGSTGTNLVTLSGCDLLSLCGVLAEETSQGNNWQGVPYQASHWSPQSWYESQWVTGLSGNNWQTSTWATGNNWQGNNWQGSTWYSTKDKKSYGTTTRGSGSYGAWG